MKVWAKIPAREPAELAGGRQRRGDLDVFRGVLERLGEARSVHLAGDGSRLGAAIGLATTAAAAGRRVALLEADLARPGLAGTVGLAPAPGLAEYLRGEQEAAAVLQAVALAGPGAGDAREPLVCVVGGAPGEDSTRLLASERFRVAFDGLRGAYDLVVVAGPSLVEIEAVAVLAAAAERTLAVGGRRSVPRTLRRYIDAVLVPR